MSRISLGEHLACDLTSLTDTRLLIQANSGGGKSWCLRRLLEQSHGKLQHLVIDPEGEFASLRERFDYVHAAKSGGDTAADPRSAKLLAERLLELGVSAILDIYELKAHERIRFVRAFLEALINAPKNLWHPALVVVDEAHVYCPQKGEAESAGAVIDLATRGRKRGFCAVLATQRLSKLHKDAAAELNNKLIGRTGLDVDMKRAGEELGFTGREEMHQLRTLEPGEFFAFGPALSASVKRGRVGPVQTSHPKAGSRLAFTPPPPTAKVRALLPKLADLPAEVEQRERSVAELKAELATVKRELAKKPVPIAPAPAKEKPPRVVEKPVISDAQVNRLAKAIEQLAAFSGKLVEYTAILRAQLTTATAINQGKYDPRPFAPPIARALRDTAERLRQHPPIREPARPPGGRTGSSNEARLRKGALRMLEALARRHPAPTTSAQMAQLAGLARTGGTFSTYLSDLRVGGYLTESGDFVELTELGWEAIGQTPGALSPQTTPEMLALYAGVLRGGARRMLEVLVEIYPQVMTKEELAAAADVAATGGTFSTYLSDLRRSGLIAENGHGTIAASELLMNPGGA